MSDGTYTDGGECFARVDATHGSVAGGGWFGGGFAGWGWAFGGDVGFDAFGLGDTERHEQFGAVFCGQAC